MDQADSLGKRALADFKAGRARFELYERFYRSLSPQARQYLGRESKKYKEALRAVQALILPAVREFCLICETPCCRLDSPETCIYTAGTVGGFDLNDYLLVRSDTILPAPRYENAEKNRCPFWEKGCTLPLDCRSSVCTQYFCDNLRRKLDMDAVTEAVARMQTILDTFSIRQCML